MTITLLFAISGFIIVSMALAKKWEERRKRPTIILSAISKGDAWVKNMNHHAADIYTQGRERSLFIIQKQAPLRAKSFWNKFVAYVQKMSDKYVGDVRDSRLLKRSGGISEFFKNISEIEKGNGEINEHYSELESLENSLTTSSRETGSPAAISETTGESMILPETKVEIVETPIPVAKESIEVVVEEPKPKKKRSYTRKKTQGASSSKGSKRVKISEVL
jgi:hypothetical protein